MRLDQAIQVFWLRCAPDLRHRRLVRARTSCGPMLPLLAPILNERADSSLSSRGRLYRRGDRSELLRDLIALANAGAVVRRFLINGVEDKPGSERRFPGVAARRWKSFCNLLTDYVDRTVEPRLAPVMQSTEVDDVPVGGVCLDSREDTPYLPAGRISSTMPAGGGWARRGVKQHRPVRKDLQRVFEQRCWRQTELINRSCAGRRGWPRLRAHTTNAASDRHAIRRDNRCPRARGEIRRPMRKAPPDPAIHAP